MDSITTIHPLGDEQRLGKRRRCASFVGWSGLLIGLLSSGCSGTGGATTDDRSSRGEPSAVRGAEIYRTYCTACHNADPRLPGTIGPEIKGSPRELIEARVLRAEYPAGYKPKRSSKNMTALPQLVGDIDDLEAFLR